MRGSLCPNRNALGIGVCWPHRTVMDAVDPEGLAHSLTSIRSCRHPGDGGGESEVDRCTAHVPPPREQEEGPGLQGQVRTWGGWAVWAASKRAALGVSRQAGALLCDLGTRNISTPRSPVTPEAKAAVSLPTYTPAASPSFGHL